ncbi:hypothetical protein DMI60_26955 [Escherichia coli]|nr:hypothetical protein [Escherichia coli]
MNKSQSSNDVFPTAMHVAALLALRKQLIPQLKTLTQTLSEKIPRICRYRQNRSYPLAGRDAVNAGAGDFRLGSDAGA